MIPPTDRLLTLTPRNAQVLGGGLGSEKHGKAKKTFVDVKVSVLVPPEEFDAMLGYLPGDDGPPPSEMIFAGQTIRYPSLTTQGSVREMRGVLHLRGYGDPMVFEDAHVVGGTNRLEFLSGPHGVLTLQFRVDAGRKAHRIIEIIDRGECLLEFTETEPDTPAPVKNENQGDLL